MNRFLFSCLAGAALLLTGCESMMEKTPAQKAEEQKQKQLQAQMQQRLSQTQENAKTYEGQLAQLNMVVRSLQDENVAALAKMNELQRQVSMSTQLVQRHEQEIAALKQQLAAEQQARQEGMNRVVEQAAKEAAAAVSAYSKSSAGSSSGKSAGTSSSSSAAPAGTYYEYTVEAGATLGAIAKAYNVSAEEIRAANKLKSDSLRVGQKLYIPKKK